MKIHIESFFTIKSGFMYTFFLLNRLTLRTKNFEHFVSLNKFVVDLDIHYKECGGVVNATDEMMDNSALFRVHTQSSKQRVCFKLIH